MSLAGYSTCRIQFIPTDQPRSARDYSDRSLIELRQYDFADYSLRALDIENNKAEIFNIPFKKKEQYKRGQSIAHPDEVHSTTGIYRLWLNATSRVNFHEALNICIEQLQIAADDSSQSQTSSSSVTLKENPLRDSETSRSTTYSNQNDILVDVSQLGHCIREGDVDKAVDVTKKLAMQHVQLQANLGRQRNEEKILMIRVKIDSNDKKISDKGIEIKMSVYPSTTIRELCTAIKYSNNCPQSQNQYVFVNGHLAHETSTMADLNIHRDSLFVLLIL